MREWLTVIVALLILAVVLDGIRRMRQARRSNIRVSRAAMRRGQEAGGDAEAESYGSELPNGGARVVNVRQPDDAEQLYRKIRQTREQKHRKLGKSQRIPQQVALNLDEHVPTLMEVEESSQPSSTAKSTRKKPQPASAAPANERIEPQISEAPLDLDEPLAKADNWSADDEPEWDDDEFFAPAQDEDDDFVAEPIAAEADADDLDEDDVEEGEPDFREPEEVLVINVMAHKGERFRGDLLLDTVLDRGMRFGSMNIFHHQQRDGKGPTLYSMANIVVPGTFDLATMRDFSTPGVSLFMALPLDADSSAAFELMLGTARAIADNLDGEMKDENRSVMTAQTIEHYRSRIKEFERKQLSKAPV